MFGSFYVGRLFGIPIRATWGFTFVAVLVLMQMRPALALALLLALLLHELGHALVARRSGLQVFDITLWALGGMARMSQIPEEPRMEARIASAGPLVNLALAAISAAGLLPALLLPDSPLTNWLANFALLSVAVNLALGVFNLVPAFPMDGGRILRGFLARKRSWIEATELAVRVGRWIAVGAVVVTLVASVLLPGNYVFGVGIVAVFVWLMGGRELWSVRMRHGFEPWNPDAASAEPRVETAAPPPPSDSPRDSLGARRPQVLEFDFQDAAGITDEDVRAMERFRGRLPRFDSVE